MARISWHPAFVQAIQLELEDYLDVLTFESEHQLTTEPLKIDVLIIKKMKKITVEKNIGQIFQQYNVVEYKSPNDHITISDYHKTQCYARLYAALNKADVNDMSLSVVVTRHPKKLLAYLKKQYTMEHTHPGIYVIKGDTCPTQVIVSEELPEEENSWLNSLRVGLTQDQTGHIRAVIEHKPALPIDAYLQAVIAANIKVFEELYMNDTKRYEALIERACGPRLRAEGAAIGEARGIVIGEAKGEAKGKAEAVLTFLRTRFKKVPKRVEQSIRKTTDLNILDSWTARAATCQSIDEFAQALHN